MINLLLMVIFLNLKFIIMIKYYFPIRLLEVDYNINNVEYSDLDFDGERNYFKS